MEAAGIEPASEDLQRKASTCLAPSLISRRGTRRGGESASPAPMLFRSPGSWPTRFAILLCRRFSRAAGVNLRNGVPFYQAAKGSVSALTCFHRFTREMGSRHAAFASKSPSNPFAPISCIEVGRRYYSSSAPEYKIGVSNLISAFSIPQSSGKLGHEYTVADF